MLLPLLAAIFAVGQCAQAQLDLPPPTPGGPGMPTTVLSNELPSPSPASKSLVSIRPPTTIGAQSPSIAMPVEPTSTVPRNPFSLASSVTLAADPAAQFAAEATLTSMANFNAPALVHITEAQEPAYLEPLAAPPEIPAVPTETASVLQTTSIYDPAAPACNTGVCSTGNCVCGNFQMNASTRLGRFAQGVYAGTCCPDPCYAPNWTMLANASLFSDTARPQSRQRFRWDYNDHFVQPDRAEYLWARMGALGPAPERSIDFHELTMMAEMATDKFSFFIETPYRSIDLESGGHFAGFADITTGTKTLLHDTRLIQIAFQFETHIPTSSPSKGLSNGHVSLEPGLLGGIQLSDRSFLQMQLAQWIPLGGNPHHAGALLRHSMSYNRLLMGSANNTSLVGTIEYAAFHFQDGQFTDPLGNLRPASNEAVFQYGGGLRLNICNKFNFGFGSLFSGDDWPAAALRTEFQWLH